jgi:hypothetical protein
MFTNVASGEVARTAHCWPFRGVMQVVAETDNVADALKNMVSGVSKWRMQPRGLCTMTPLSVYVGL